MKVRDKIIAITPFVALIAFIILAYFDHAHPGWMVFLLIPLMPFIVGKDKIRITYPLVILILYLAVGILAGLWHPTWVIFITIPIYYILFPPFRKHHIRIEPDDGENNQDKFYEEI